ncbi:hypothetical protein Avbf_04293, partial [Armadillidium vulgare]
MMNINIGNDFNKQNVLACLELILSNVESKSIDYAFVTKLYEDASMEMKTLASNTDSQFLMDSINSLLEMFKLHEELLENLRLSEKGNWSQFQ